ncbi:MAG: DsbA family protein [Defluviitaleaceae bacterium]|nr:DsbA family protein [Defluviitaleaceae bacterium]
MSTNKRQIEFFFDYACPYCNKIYHSLAELISHFPGTEIIWRPCESHPRPNRHDQHQHSDLCIQAMFFAAEHGTDMQKYHERAFSLMHESSVNVEDIDILSQSLSDLLNTESLRDALLTEKYAPALQAANAYAFEQSEVWALPAFRMDSRKLDSELEIGITHDQLLEFLGRV